MLGFGNKSAPMRPAPVRPGASPTAPPAPAAIEPWIPTPQEEEWLRRIHQALLQQLELSRLGLLDEAAARREIREQALRMMTDLSVPLSVHVRQQMAQRIEDEILGLGPLEPLLLDPTVSDILVNGPEKVFVERGGKLEPTALRFRDEAHLMTIIDRIVTRVGRRIDEASPMVDARLPDGSRVNAIIPPLALDGAMLSIRRFARDRMAIEDFIRIGTLTEPIARVLEGIVRCRLNVLISGGTGSGKTTMLNVMSGFIPANERILTIEDSAELQLRQPHVGRMETRPANIEGRGNVTQRDLVRNALRMRPDRIIVGEVRGGEALDMLQAMNTGHDGSLTTIHANTPRDALSRIENMVAMAGVDLPTKAVRSQIASAIDIVIQLERMEDGRRRLVSLQEIQGMEGDIVTMAEIFRFEREGLDADGNVVGAFVATGLVPHFHDHLRRRGLELDLAMFDPDRKL
ncbi:CpaF family protein [Sinimarinibacterium sp. CAU 1509]|uniref:CpaF family protein n=1 Tax=Sinimarinibacterium sp. CAU 1509 TaxID=2562283 RepID=UPI0010ABFCED|nr:CpaF family protein [Sinimarinibacterium sp. CAU 1509]TJY65269.1 CpaF family protein [Sinimarinibacterium sp. CAU 1509]